MGILDDSKKLLIDHNLDLIGCMDLRHLAVRNGSVPGKLGLKSLAFHYLNVHLNKVRIHLWLCVMCMGSFCVIDMKTCLQKCESLYILSMKGQRSPIGMF